ncbi:MAG: hypothetical protein AAF467_11225 [Actinomycetota bacterium]
MSGDDPIIDLEHLLNPDEQQQFRQLCLPTSAEELAEMAEVVEFHLVQIKDMAHPNADLELAERITASLLALLGEDADFDADERALIRGAIEYFILADDASDDMADLLGFDDDARVVNSVLDRIGRPQHRIDLA